MNERPVLSGVSLCAIVRDEMINPAGGIVDFVECTVPFVEEAFILDTGSKDDTFEELKRLKQRHRNLRIGQTKFIGYAEMRNKALRKIKTSFVLVLDADERLFESDFINLEEHLINFRASILQGQTLIGLNFDLRCLEEEEGESYLGSLHNPRLFKLSSNLRYRNQMSYYSEYLYVDDKLAFSLRDVYGNRLCLKIPVEIKHFLPPHEGLISKREEWYKGIVRFNKADAKSPFETESYFKWKQLNPQRKEFGQ